MEVTTEMRAKWAAKTEEHVRRVRVNMNVLRLNLLERAIDHDKSKFIEPEFSGYAALEADLSTITYGTLEYREALQEAHHVIGHHYAGNDHHPEHFDGGMEDMNLLQLMEMLADWKAASERSRDGDLSKSFAVHRERNGDSLVLRMLERTAQEVGWLDA